MTGKQVLHMNAGNGKTSYANNSGFQKVAISKTRSVLDETLKDMFNTHENGFPKCLKMADFGCSSGPNSLLVISHIIDTIQEMCRNNNVKSMPQLEVCLNDLPDNDFNNLFKLLSNFSRCKLECFVYGVPGSFYDRLFPSNSLHFAYSSYSIHWLSQIPPGVGKNNKENIYMSMTSPPQVFDAYAKQFQKDFSRFLSFRRHEMIAGGRMVLSFVGRSAADPSSADEMASVTMVAETLSDMVAEGLIKKDDLYSFNIPFYAPCVQEVEAIISNEGSFSLDKVEVVFVPWDGNNDYDDVVFDKYKSGKLVANSLRAILEPLLVCHFGSSIDIDAVFHRYTSKITERLPMEGSSYFTQVISLTRK